MEKQKYIVLAAAALAGLKAYQGAINSARARWRAVYFLLGVNLIFSLIIIGKLFYG